MWGSFRQPVPGIGNDNVPFRIADADECPVKAKMYPPSKPRYIFDKPAMRLASASEALKIAKKDAEKYDPTLGCRACTEVITGRDSNRHTITRDIPHISDCSTRMTELMMTDDIDRARVDKAERRLAFVSRRL